MVPTDQPGADDPAYDDVELFERRSHPRAAARIGVHLVRVGDAGQIAGEEWTEAEELSPGGARVVTHLPLLSNERLWIEERGGGFASWGAVRSVSTGSDGQRRVGIEFLPNAGPPPSPRRRHDRLGAQVALVLTRIDPDGTPGESERTVTEDISPGGARVLTRLDSIREGEIVTLGEAASEFQTRARVAGAWRGSDGRRHLNLEFEEPLPL